MMRKRFVPLIPVDGSSFTRIALYLSLEERQQLSKIDPRCRIPQDDQKSDEKKNDKNEKNEENNKVAKQDETKNTSSDKNESKSDEKDEKKKEQKVFVVADPDTLLARLNTKRLYKRLKYVRKEQRKQKDKKHDDEKKECSTATTDESISSVYPLKMTTQQIAMKEWQDILESAKKTKGQQQQDDKHKKQNSFLPLPSPYELLLFSPCPRPVTVLASYPRSGNSLLRNLFERVTLRVTGSDMRGGLTQHDLVGEAAVSTQKVQFVKTHFPERPGKTSFPASRAVLLVRNPYDAIESYFNLMMTNTHTTTVEDDIRKKNEKVFREMALKEIHVWRMFHLYWLQKKIPILLIRYEDLIRNPDKVLARVIRFVLEINNMTFFQHRIDRCIREEQIENVGAYKPRSGGIGKSMKSYPPVLLRNMNRSIVELMHQLGYGELLNQSQPEKWEIPPIPGYGFELNPKRQQQQQKQSTAAIKPEIVMINGGPIVRGPKLFTNWKEIRKEVFGEDQSNNPKKDDIQNPYEIVLDQ